MVQIKARHQPGVAKVTTNDASTNRIICSRAIAKTRRSAMNTRKTDDGSYKYKYISIYMYEPARKK